jgi:WD40 repeat protein/cell wall assembly regulator SMI1
MTTDALEETILNRQLEHEALDLITRVNRAFTLRTGKPARQSNWTHASQVGPLQITQIERALACKLPADVVAFYLACNGILATGGWHLKPAFDAQLNTRLMNTLMVMREGCVGWEYPSEEFNADNMVRTGWWREGWIPIAHNQSDPHFKWLCIDTVPGPAGQWGQLIEVTNASWETAQRAQPARWVAAGLMDFFETLALALEADPVPQAVTHWLEDTMNRTLQADTIDLVKAVRKPSSTLLALQRLQAEQATQIPAELKVEPDLQLGDLCKPHLIPTKQRKDRINDKLEATWQDVRQGVSGFNLYHPPNMGNSVFVEDWLKKWSLSKIGSTIFCAAPWGSGKSDSILSLAEYLATQHHKDAQSRVPFYIDLEKHIPPHVSADQIPCSLEQLVSAELKFRGLPDAPNTVMLAIRDGRCVLMLDHAEAFATYRSDLWSWMQQLPVHGSDGESRSAFLLMAACSEWFDTNIEQIDVLECLQLSVAHNRDKYYYLALHARAYDSWLNAIGVPLKNDPVRQATWNIMRYDAYALPALSKALKPLLEKPFIAAQKKHPISLLFEVYGAWWTFVLPDDREADKRFFLTIAATIAMVMDANSVQSRGQSDIPPHIFADIVKDQWPQASAGEQRQLRMLVRIALRLNMDTAGKIRLRDRPNDWLALAICHNFKEGDVDNSLEMIAQQSDASSLLQTLAQYWFDLDSEQPLAIAKDMLCQPQTHSRAGVLFLLGIAMARVYARGHNLQLVLQQMERVLPMPLSRANLVGADLANADLSRLTLEDADFSHANLDGAQFACSTLRRVQLNDAAANKANFHQAILCDVQADRLRAHHSSWIHAQWDRLWPAADLDQAVVSVPGVTPQTQASNYQFKPVLGSVTVSVNSMCSSDEGRWLGVVGKDRSISVWNAENLQTLWHMSMPEGFLGNVLSLCFSSDGQRLFSSHEDCSIYGWATEDGKLLAHRLNWPTPIQNLQRSNDKKSLVAYSFNSHDNIYLLAEDLPLGSNIGWQSRGRDDRWWAMVMASNPERGYFCVSQAHETNYVEVYGNNIPLRQTVSWSKSFVWDLALRADTVQGHDWLAVIEENAIVVGDPDAATYQWRFECPLAAQNSAEYLERIHRHLRVPLKDLPAEKRHYGLGKAESQDMDKKLAHLSFSPDGRWLACVGENVKARIFDLHAGTEHRLQNCDDCVSIAFTSDGRNIILGGAQLKRQALPKV